VLKVLEDNGISVYIGPMKFGRAAPRKKTGTAIARPRQASPAGGQELAEIFMPRLPSTAPELPLRQTTEQCRSDRLCKWKSSRAIGTQCQAREQCHSSGDRFGHASAGTEAMRRSQGAVVVQAIACNFRRRDVAESDRNSASELSFAGAPDEGAGPRVICKR